MEGCGSSSFKLLSQHLLRIAEGDQYIYQDGRWAEPGNEPETSRILGKNDILSSASVLSLSVFAFKNMRIRNDTAGIVLRIQPKD